MEPLAVIVAPSARFVVEVTPSPDRLTASGSVAALLVTDNVPVWLPPLVGENATFSVVKNPLTKIAGRRSCSSGCTGR